MDSALLVHRLQFALAATFHYLFPQLTMGLAPLIVVLKTVGLRTGNEIYNQAARFWARIFGITFVTGVVTGCASDRNDVPSTIVASTPSGCPIKRRSCSSALPSLLRQCRCPTR